MPARIAQGSNVVKSVETARNANVTRDDLRVRAWNDRPVRAGAEYVVYWCQAARRAVDNPALELAVARANELDLPVVVYEALRPDYPHASARLHAFVLQCARDTAAALRARGIAHGFFLPRTADEARGVAAKVFARAALVVSDEHPSFVYPRQNARAAAAACDCAYLTVDDTTIVPLARFGAHEHAARTLRPKLLRVLDEHLAPVSEIEPRRRAAVDWPFAPLDLARTEGARLEAAIAACAVDARVRPVDDRPGGARAAEVRLRAFLEREGRRYETARNDAVADETSGLSPYLHFGAISARRCAIAARDALPQPARDAFLEQLVVRRALAFNHAAREPRHAEWEGLPGWARATLEAHAGDPRGGAAGALGVGTLERAESADRVWNAAQRDLVDHGRMHNVMRMYWGKQLLPLLPSPRAAFDFGVAMMDRYALDGRDPNTYTGVGWCFGLHDQPFPERAIFGKVRPMGLGALKKRFDVEAYARGVRQPSLFG
jgi:deoxyribodipyrimidine photo-lyase